MRFEQPASSPLLGGPGRGRVFMNGRTHHVSWETTRSEGRVVVFADGRRLTIDDYNERWGYVSQTPNDEFELIHAMAPLAEGEPDPADIPDDRRLRRIASGFDAALTARISKRDLRASEAEFYRLSIANSAVMLRRVLHFGDVEAAIRDAIAVR